MTRTILLLILTCTAVQGQEAETTSAHDLVRQAKAEFDAGNFQAAQQAYQSASEILGPTPEISYNLGLTHYRLGEFEQARKYFQDALATRDESLESKSKYNLGNTAYGQALAASQAPAQGDAGPEGTSPEQLLNQAINHYGDALSLNPDDQDARANIELAQRMIEQLKQHQQQQQQQQQENQEQQNQDQQQQNQQEQSQESEQQQQQQEQQQEQQENSVSSESPQDQQQPSPDEPQDEQQQQQPSEPQEQEEQESQTQEQEQQAKELSEQEAEKILQSVRDKERQRNEKKAKAQRAKRAPVAKDW